MRRLPGIPTSGAPRGWPGHASIGLVAALLASSGCLDMNVSFRCTSSTQCAIRGEAGICERNGACSFADTGCPSGRRYGRHSVALGGTCVQCGNKVVDADEECDDGNAIETDACLPSCRWARCGDGIVRSTVEECDDGNTTGGDGCSPACLRCDAGDDRFTWDADGNGHCYSRHDARGSWWTGRDGCIAANAHLVTYTGYEQREVIARLLGPPRGASWIGLFDENGVNDFVWITGEPVVQTNWAANEPNPSNPAEDCVAQAADGRWADLTCSSTAGYLCENPGWTIRPADNHAYRAFFQKLAWEPARDACAALGGHLATVTTLEEHAFVAAQFPGIRWLGGVETDADRTFGWVTGEPFAFHQFAPNEPDEGAGADCLVIGQDRVWHDRKCANVYGFICEID